MAGANGRRAPRSQDVHSPRHHLGGLWKLPELWTRKQTRAHELLGRRQTDAAAHSYHKALASVHPHGERKEDTGFIESAADALRAKPVDGPSKPTRGRRPQVSVDGTTLRPALYPDLNETEDPQILRPPPGWPVSKRSLLAGFGRSVTGMTGPQIVELVTQARPEMKVLYISGYSDESVVRHGLIGPGRAFLSKPFGPDALLQKLRESLDTG